jgi:prevent-host-death family protein
MKVFSANDAKQSLGLLLDTAQSEPVLIRKHNRDAAIVISPKEYDRLRGINVAEFSEFCDRVGEKAARKGLTEAKLASLLA